MRRPAPRRLPAPSLLLLALLGAALLPGRAWAAFTIVRTSAPVFYVDDATNPALLGNYASYQVTSDAAEADAWVTIGGFTGGVVARAPNGDGVVHLGSFSPGQTKTAFFYLTASGTTATPQAHSLEVWDRNPTLPGVQRLHGPQSFTLSGVEDTIAAQANKVTTVVSGPVPASLGGIVTVTVTGESGTVGNAGIFSFTPACLTDWPARAYELFSTSITLPNGTVLTDRLYTSGYSGASGTYTAVYRFVATGASSAPAAVNPVGYISSGTQVKHTDVGGSGGNSTPIPPLDPPVNTTTLSASVGTGCPLTLTPAGGRVTVTVAIANTGSNPVALDTIVATFPGLTASSIYVGGTARYDNAATTAPFFSGSSLYFSGSYPVPAGSTRTLAFDVTYPASAGSYPLSVVGLVGSTRIDTTVSTSDDAPATCGVTVLARPTVAKAFSPDSIGPGGTSRLSLVLSNPNAIALTAVSLSDAFPTSPAAMVVATVPNASDNCGGTFSAPAGAGAVSLAGGTIAAGGTCSLAVDVTVPATGSYGNTSGGVVSTQTASTGFPSNTATLASNVTELALAKAVDRAQALPGEAILYTITYRNGGTTTLSSIRIQDGVPANTTFVSGGCTTPLPAALTSCALTTAPAAGGTGPLEWTFGGTLSPGGTGTVTFTVRVDP